MKFEVRSKSKAAPQMHQVSKPAADNKDFVKAAKAHLNQTRKVRAAVANRAAPGFQTQVKKLDRHIAKVASRIQSETAPGKS